MGLNSPFQQREHEGEQDTIYVLNLLFGQEQKVVKKNT